MMRSKWRTPGVVLLGEAQYRDAVIMQVEVDRHHGGPGIGDMDSPMPTARLAEVPV